MDPRSAATALGLADPPGRWSRAPWHFRLAKYMIRHRLRGGYRLIELAERRGWLNGLVRYRLSDRVSLDVPLWRRPNQWDTVDIHEYERPLIDRLAAAIARMRGPVHLIDCGADIGLITARLIARCPQITSATALEPNEAAFAVLRENTARMPIPVEAHQAAVANETGRGNLRSPLYDDSDHALYFEPSTDGSIRVMRIDELEVPPGANLVLKVDVEGGELAVLQGAQASLRVAPECVVAWEAHRRVVERTGIEPLECLRLLRSIRPCDVMIAERPELAIDETKGFFEQVLDGDIYNLVASTLPRTSAG